MTEMGPHEDAEQEEWLRFDNPAFKIAIVQELMYAQGVLTPRFDVRAFVAQHTEYGIDLSRFTSAVIPEVLEWFEDLPVPAALAPRVERLLLDGGNAIYGQLTPHWHGEDDLFDIDEISEAELAQFPRLRLVHVDGPALGPVALKTLEAYGVELTGFGA